MIGFVLNVVFLLFIGEDGWFSGLVSEYLQCLMQVGVNLKVENSYDWYEVCEKVCRGELQVVMGIFVDLCYLGLDWVFSQFFISVLNVIVVRSDGELLLGLVDLQGKCVLLFDLECVCGYVQQQVLQVWIIVVWSVEQVLQCLFEGEVDVYVGNFVVVDYLLCSCFLGWMQVVVLVGFNDQLVLVVDCCYVVLVMIFDCLLLQMILCKCEVLCSDWLVVEYCNGVDWSNLLWWGVLVLMVLLIVLLVYGVGYWWLCCEVVGCCQLEQ